MKNTPSTRIGRPTKAPKEGERVSLGLRVTADLKRRLDAAAERNGRSQSQEAEMRLARSFSLEDDKGGAEEAALAALVAGAFLRGGQQAAKLKWQPFGKKSGPAPWQKPGASIPANVWSNDPECFAQACVALVYLLDLIAPEATEPVEAAADHGMAPSMADIVGQVTTNQLLGEILGDWHKRPVAGVRPNAADRRVLTGAAKNEDGNG